MEYRLENKTALKPKAGLPLTGLSLTKVLTPGADLQAYIQTINNIPILSDKEEAALAGKFCENQDVDAARILVMTHLRFVVHIARSYMGYGLPLADLIQEGNLGLMKAVKRFDPKVGVRLISFAVHWIKAEIHEFVLKNWRIVKVATTKAQRKLFFNLRSSKKSLTWLTDKETDAIAKSLKVSSKVVREMENRLSAQDAVFDSSPDSESEDNTSAYQAPENYLPGSAQDNPEFFLEQERSETLSRQQLSMAIEKLDERSKIILVSRWLSEKKATLHELAARFKVSPERIRQIETAAMKKIRQQIAPHEPHFSC